MISQEIVISKNKRETERGKKEINKKKERKN
jgi:hypothetical protein